MYNILEAFVKFRIFILLAIITVFGSPALVSAQVDSVIGQVSSSTAASFASGISGDGRFIVFESTGNLATENPRNSDGSREIFLFDYAQRRIFQITDTKSLLIDTDEPIIFSNIKVDILSVRPTISNDGRWIAFGSNATTARPDDKAPNTTNPGSFDANSFTDMDGDNILTEDGNTEMWLYQVPMTTPVNLSLGAEIPLTDLSTGTFTRVTNTFPTVLPAPGTTSTLPVIADDNRDVSISDDGNVISFTSNRDLVPAVGNPPGQTPREDNDEIFTYVRSANVLGQVTKTLRGAITAPIFSLNSTISGNGLRVAFASNGDAPIVGMPTPGNNADRNIEIFFSDLDATGTPTGTRKQITQTARTNPGDIVNTLNFGRRMSRDGRYIAFDSFANIGGNGTGSTNETSFALYLFDANAVAENAVRQIGPRSTADSGANGGDVNHFPGFTEGFEIIDGVPQLQTKLILGTRLNITAAGVIPSNADDGLNPDTTRPTQVYSYNLSAPANMPVFKRLTKLPAATSFIVAIQPLTTDFESRLAFNLGLTEVGTGNPDQLTEVFYLLNPTVSRQTVSNISFATGATRIPVSPDPVPTPSPTATPTPTPTPSPSPTPTPTPTPQTPPAVHGISPGMLAILNYDSGFGNPVQVITAEGSLSRRFNLPIELGGVSMTINGVACGLKSVGRREIVFVAPPALSVSSTEGTSYPVVINNNGVVTKGTVTLVTARPDIFTYNFTDIDGNLFTNRPRLFNATNRVLTREPFTVTTVRTRGGVRVPTVLRLYLTGIEGAPIEVSGLPVITIRIGDETIAGSTRVLTGAVLREPGVYTVDFRLPPELDMAGDVPIVFSILFDGITYQSRLDDTAPFVRIL